MNFVIVELEPEWDMKSSPINSQLALLTASATLFSDLKKEERSQNRGRAKIGLILVYKFIWKGDLVSWDLHLYQRNGFSK